MKWLALIKMVKSYRSWIIGIALVLAFGVGYVSSRFLPHDSPIEQAAEQVIDRLSGIELDFTPDEN